MQIYLPIAELPVSIFLVLGMSAAVGFVSGLFGVGGGFLMTPLLVFIGIPAHVAVASGAAQIAASSTTGAIAYWRRRSLDAKLGTVLVAGGIAGTVLGVWTFNAARRAGQFEVVFVLSYVLILGLVGGWMLFESLRAMMRRRRGKPQRLRRAGRHAWYEKLPLRMRFHRSRLYISALPLAALGLAIGFVGSVLGIGGGFIVVPALIYLFRVPTAVVVGTSLYQILVTMLVATILHAVTNQSVDIVLALIMTVGSVIGAQFGTRAGQNLRGEQYRLLLALLVFGVAIRFGLDLGFRPEEIYSIGPMEPRQ